MEPSRSSSTLRAAGYSDDGVTSQPPYWHAHQRTASNASYQTYQKTCNHVPIVLEDHTTDSQNEDNKFLWARKVTVDDYIIVSGSGLGVGSYVVWNCTIETLEGGSMKMNKRYSEFDELRRNLAKTYSHSERSLPPLPRKSVFSKYNPQFLENRRAGLAYFLDCVLLNPEFASSPILKDFLFART